MGGMNNGVVDTVARGEAVAAQADATQALADAGAAQADATQALANAGAAQTTANNALAGSFYGAAPVDVTASRAINVTYTNTTGRPILVNVTCYQTASAYVVQMLVNAETVFGGGSVANGNSTGSFLIPVGATYKLTTAVNVLTKWTETKV